MRILDSRNEKLFKSSFWNKFHSRIITLYASHQLKINIIIYNVFINAKQKATLLLIKNCYFYLFYM
jgi:hypothetical protein